MDFKWLGLISAAVLLLSGSSGSASKDNSHGRTCISQAKVSGPAYTGEISLFDGEGLKNPGVPGYSAQLLDALCNKHMDVAFFGDTGSKANHFQVRGLFRAQPANTLELMVADAEVDFSDPDKLEKGIGALDRQIVQRLRKNGWSGTQVLMVHQGMIKASAAGWGIVYNAKKM